MDDNLYSLTYDSVTKYYYVILNFTKDYMTSTSTHILHIYVYSTA